MMTMNKRKRSADVCSDSSVTSMVYNPETVFDVNDECSCGSVGKIPRLNLGKSIEYNLFHDVQLNGSPFNDFCVSKDDAKVSENYSNSTGVYLDLTLSLSLPLSVSPPCGDTDTDTNTNPVLSKTVLSDDASSAYSENTDSETETVLDAIPLNVYIPADVNVAVAAVGTVPVELEWTVTKVLTKSDCNDQSRLLISRKIAEPHILRYFDESSRKQVDSPIGLRLDMFDYDTGSWVGVTMKRWPSTGSIALMKNWRRDFVVRRGLKEGDQVGLCWDDQCNTLSFSVLRKAPFIEN